MSYLDSDDYKAIGFTALIGMALICLYVFVFMRIRLSHLIAVNFMDKVGFPVFFEDGNDTSVAFRVALGIAISAGIIIGAIGLFSGEGGLVGIGVAVATVGILVLRLVIALLGYIIWFIFSPIMIIVFMIAMLVLMIIFAVEIVETGGKVGAGFFMGFIMLVSIILCIIGFRYAAGDSMEDVVVWVIRLFV